MELCEKIRSAIDEAELSQKELAELCGVAASTVTMWLHKDPSKRTTPPLHTLMMISNATGVPIREFTDLLDKEVDVGQFEKNGDKVIPDWERIKLARKSRKLTQADLGEACGVTRSSIANWESADKISSPKPRQLRRIAEITGIPFTWLSGETNSTPENLIKLSSASKNDDLEKDLLKLSKERKDDALHVILDLYTYVKEHGISQELYEVIKNTTYAVKRYCK
ncbi:helix-turn-helix domain-containing protein [Zooshikella ganghwensis]|uniref:Helix-turn-helix domain-containing protein n=1 Tax=Zooshikella ganghwensis TaxID=202772 RepID=A0A4P9VHL8_9GAMM|nr:helix-turn-helix transcriptional regulator [Zooshikella ganghwensis]RDH41710.1 helix-turn-helix domain-containing protein [Zooshikella ganghwensis]